MARLRITEVFLSLQGESDTQGWPTVFVRLTGCPLRCNYCDTAYAFQGGEYRELDDLVEQIQSFGVRHVTVSGGEPLAQKDCLELLSRLCDLGLLVSLETSGAIDIAPVDTRVSRVLDIKTPGSGEVERNLWSNLEQLTDHDQLKFVICDRADYEWSRTKLEEQQLDRRCQVWFSPSFGQVNATELADWIVQDRLPVRMQIQLHKILWGDEPGR